MESLVGTYRILQPGSSVATSLSMSESSRCPKHMALFDIKQKMFRMKKVPFTQVRVFMYDDLVLKDFPSLDANNPKIEEDIKDLLVDKVAKMVEDGRKMVQEPTEEDRQANSRFRIKEPHKILVRLRVDREGFPAINQQRFGAQFVGEVANPNEILLFAKKRRDVPLHMRVADGASATRMRSADGQGSGGGDVWQILADGAEEEIHKIKIEDLVNETLANSKNSLTLLTEMEMAQVFFISCTFYGLLFF